jgi:hypothetical protein
MDFAAKTALIAGSTLGKESHAAHTFGHASHSW